jgi:hypothetical protein
MSGGDKRADAVVGLVPPPLKAESLYGSSPL